MANVYYHNIKSIAKIKLKAELFFLNNMYHECTSMKEFAGSRIESCIEQGKNVKALVTGEIKRTEKWIYALESDYTGHKPNPEAKHDAILYKLRAYKDELVSEFKAYNELQLKESVQVTDGRMSNRITHEQSLKAIQELAPEFVERLRKADTKTKKTVLNLITGRNGVDGYKLLFTEQKKKLEKVEIKGLEELKEKLGIIQTNK